MVIEDFNNFDKSKDILRLDLSIIIPTLNEINNIDPLLMQLDDVFRTSNIEVIFVDDSDDGTPCMIKSVVNKFPNLKVQLIHRLSGQRYGGLGGAVVVGLELAHGEYACVMDCDLQHPPEVIPQLIRSALQQQADLVVAVRQGRKMATRSFMFRNIISRTLEEMARLFLRSELRNIDDPLTGFFLVRTQSIETKLLSPRGFKILIEIIVSHPHLKITEVPFNFGDRLSGRSKASVNELINYFYVILSLFFRRHMMAKRSKTTNGPDRW